MTTLNVRSVKAIDKFIDMHFAEDRDGCIFVNDAYSMFKDWCSYYKMRPPALGDFKAWIEHRLQQPYGEGKNRGWYGVSMVLPDEIEAK